MTTNDPDRPIRMGTRASLLAVTQTNLVVAALRNAGATVEVETVTTRGDSGADVPISSLGSDGVFVRELEQALLDGRIDAAVHSLKDLPTAETPGLDLACMPARALPFDVLVCREPATLASLAPGAVVGTSSIRRVMQLRAIRDDLDIRPLRGNVDTRLRRLDAGDYDALILAGAGLERLSRGDRISAVLEPPAFWPAIAQGAPAPATSGCEPGSIRSTTPRPTLPFWRNVPAWRRSPVAVSLRSAAGPGSMAWGISCSARACSVHPAQVSSGSSRRIRSRSRRASLVRPPG